MKGQVCARDFEEIFCYETTDVSEANRSERFYWWSYITDMTERYNGVREALEWFQGDLFQHEIDNSNESNIKEHLFSSSIGWKLSKLSIYVICIRIELIFTFIVVNNGNKSIII